MAFGVVVLVSGTGSLLQALIDATRPGPESVEPRLDLEIRAVISDRSGVAALDRAAAAGIPTEVHPLRPGTDRADWDRELTQLVAACRPDLVISAGFMKLLGASFLAEFGGRTINTHPALLPSFPGMHGPRDALAYGVKVSGATVFLVDAGVDTGRILAQRAVDVHADDTTDTLHERIKIAERDILLDVVATLSARPASPADPATNPLSNPLSNPAARTDPDNATEATR